ncbi:MAG: HAD family hydrolase [Rhodoglobus sp.]
MTWRIVLFDFDGVLCDSQRIAIEHVERLRADPAYSCLPSVRPVGHFGELYRGELRSALDRFGVSPEDARRFFSTHAGAMRKHTRDLHLFDGVPEGLKVLPSRAFAIITSSYSSAVREILLRAGIATQGLEIVGHEVQKTKTQKARELLAVRGLAVSDAVYVGDMESDIEYCRGLGLRCAAVTYGYHPREVLREARPYALLHSPSGLFEFLEKGLIAS